MLIRPERATKAFTLLELIVGIVILGILAALAIPTFSRVVERSRDATTAASVAAILRDTQALVAFGDTSWEDASKTAISETGAKLAASGFSAATTLEAKDVAELAIPTFATATYRASGTAGTGATTVALLSETDRVCFGGATATTVGKVFCADVVPASASASVASGTVSSVTMASVLGDVLSGTSDVAPIGGTPAVTTPSPSAPVTTPPVLTPPLPAAQGVVATAGDASASVAFTAVPLAASYTVTASSGQSATGTASPLVVTGLTNGVPVTFTVTSRAAGYTDSTSSASASITPVVPPRVLMASSSGTDQLLRSVDGGATWSKTKLADGSVPTGNYSVAHGPAGWVATSTTGFVLLSATGDDWVKSALPNSATGMDVIAQDGTYYLVGREPSGSVNIAVVYSSNDGRTWTKRHSSSATSSFSSIAYGNGRFVVAGYDSVAATSVNGTSWSAMALSCKGGGTTDQCYNAAYSGGRFWVSGQGGSTNFSANGTSWTAATPMGSGNGFGVAALPNGTLLAGTGGGTYSSSDGRTWTKVDSSPSNGIHEADGYFYRGTAAGLERTKDGASWTVVSSVTYLRTIVSS
jgi:prepilin-type N-terminal cleavage/methylation domain-containing protein